MPLFSRSSEHWSRRFSLRKHHPPSNVDAVSAAGLGPSHLDRKARRQTQPTIREPEQPIGMSHSLSSKALQAPPSKLSSSARSSSSTLRSTSPILNETLSGGENDTEISDISEEMVTSDSVATPFPRRVTSTRRKSEETSRSSHNNLAEYRQLQWSMSYKNRVHSDTIRGTIITSILSDSRVSERMKDLHSSQVEDERETNSQARSSSIQCVSKARISESSTTLTMPHPVVPPVPIGTMLLSSAAETSDIPAMPRMTEANVAALQTRRAFQQMVLALEDEDSGDDDDSDCDARRLSRAESSVNASVVRLGAEEYKMFQFRLRQLEELTAEQSRRQLVAEQTIEQEVQARTQTAIQAMEKQISMYKQAKELECEREVQRKVSEHLEYPRPSRSLSRASTTPRSPAASGLHSIGSSRDSYNITSASSKEEGRSLEKLLHPRRSRKRIEQMKVREEAQKREMEQFREFIRTTEMRITQAQSLDSGMSAAQMETAKHELEELADPLLPASVLHLPPSDLIHLICVMRKHGREQEQQIGQAKHLVTAAIEARKVANTTTREAIELALLLDARLDCLEKKSTRHARKPDVRHVRESQETLDISDGTLNWQTGTPSSPSALE